MSPRTHLPPESSAQSPLPTDVLIEVVSWLDPISDRSTLRTLLSVSSDLWEISAPILYSNVTLGRDQLDALLEGNVLSSSTSTTSKLRPRAQRTFAWIKTLRLVPPPSPPEVYKLWNATVPNVPLFPNVRILHLDDPPGWAERLRQLNRARRAQKKSSYDTGDDTWSTRSSVDDTCLNLIEDDESYIWPDYSALLAGNVLIFGDNVDVCVRGTYGCWRLPSLPVRSVRNLTVHREAAVTLFGDLRSGWETYQLLRIFDTGPAHFSLERLQPKLERADRGLGQRIEICLDEHEKYQGDLRTKEEVLWEGEDINFLPGADTFWQLDFDPSPCTLCGKRWEA